jgi:hypothetical protein
MTGWTLEYEGDFDRFIRSLPRYEQVVLVAALTHVLAVHGIDICASEWGKPLGRGLYEFRIRRSLDAILRLAGLAASGLPDADRSVLIRVFCSFHGHKIVLLYHGYDKKRDSSPKRQQKEIGKARKLHEAWRRKQGRP